MLAAKAGGKPLGNASGIVVKVVGDGGSVRGRFLPLVAVDDLHFIPLLLMVLVVVLLLLLSWPAFFLLSLRGRRDDDTCCRLVCGVGSCLFRWRRVFILMFQKARPCVRT